MVRSDARSPPDEPAHLGYHDVRPCGDTRPAHRTPVAAARPAGRMPGGPLRFHRLHPVDILQRGYPARKGGGTFPLLPARIPASHRRQPHRTPQHTQHTGFVAHRRQGHGTDSPALRSQRFRLDNDRGERGLLGRRNAFDAEGIQRAIREAGFTPQLRDQLYRKRDYAAALSRQ